MHMRRRTGNGFTILEMTIVLMVIGIVLSMGLELGGEMNDKASRTKTRKILSDIESALSGYYQTHGRLPCPASLTAPSDDVDFGKPPIACTATPAGTEGVYDVNSETPAVTATKEVRIGAVPVRELNLPATHMTDAWGNRIAYAVIKGLAVDANSYQTYDDGIDTIGGNTDDGAPDTDSSGAGDTTGIIRMQTKAGTQITYADKKIMVPYLLVSHGRDGKGSFNEDGGANPIACSGSNPDVENCDRDDAIFVDEQMYDIEGDADYYDDFVRWRTKDRIEYDAASVVVNTGSSLPTCTAGQIIESNADGQWVCADKGVPPGAIEAFASNACPAGWLNANAQAVSRSTYSKLFSAIGTNFGAGNGTTTFNVPELRGEFVRGWDNSRNVDSSRVFGSTQAQDYLSHTHSASAAANGDHTHASHVRYNAVGLAGGGSVHAIIDGGGAYQYFTTTTSASTGNHTHAVTVGASGGTETRPRNVALLYCIKY